MTTSDPEATTLQAAPADAAAEPKAATKAHTEPRKPRVAHGKGKSGKKTTPAQKRATKPKGEKPAKAAEGARAGSKAAKVLDLLKRPNGASIKELMKAMGWQPHSVRGFLSGTVGKKRGLTLNSTNAEDGERTYSVKA